MRLRRVMIGLSQDDVAKSVGLTFQQIQKYEYGVNRISTSRLLALGRVLNCAPSYFFEEIAKENAGLGPCHTTEATATNVDGSRSEEREALLLVRSFRSIRDAKVRETLLGLAHSLSGGSQPAI
jgi:transcriptional regulator with XRE-family HTH domain